MLVPLMTNQLVPSVETPFTISVTAWMEAFEGARDREVFPEMAREVGVSAEGLVAAAVGTEVPCQSVPPTYARLWLSRH
jgi:hypothetical protein